MRAGHNPPLLARMGGEVSFLKPSGLAFGKAPARVFDVCVWGGRPSCLCWGDLLLLYSDGINLGMDREQDQFGEDRLVEHCASHRIQPRFAQESCTPSPPSAAGAPQHDDMTLVPPRRPSPSVPVGRPKLQRHRSLVIARRDSTRAFGSTASVWSGTVPESVAELSSDET